jgi:hypothetical protein
MALQFTRDEQEWTVLETIAGDQDRLFCKAQSGETTLEMWVDRSAIVDTELSQE